MAPITPRWRRQDHHVEDEQPVEDVGRRVLAAEDRKASHVPTNGIESAIE